MNVSFLTIIKKTKNLNPKPLRLFPLLFAFPKFPQHFLRLSAIGREALQNGRNCQFVKSQKSFDCCGLQLKSSFFLSFKYSKKVSYSARVINTVFCQMCFDFGIAFFCVNEQCCCIFCNKKRQDCIPRHCRTSLKSTQCYQGCLLNAMMHFSFSFLDEFPSIFPLLIFLHIASSE